MIIFERTSRRLYFFSIISFLFSYCVISYLIIGRAAFLLNQKIGRWPLFGSIWYHVQRQNLQYKPIMLLSVLPYIVAIIGYLTYMWLVNRSDIKLITDNGVTYKTTVNPFLSVLPFIVIVLEITFNFPLLRLVVGGKDQYGMIYIVGYGILSILVLQVALVGTSGLTGRK